MNDCSKQIEPKRNNLEAILNDIYILIILIIFSDKKIYKNETQ